MTAPKQEPGTALATRETGREQMKRALSPEAQRIVEENKARNLIVQQIRGTIWSKDMNENVMRSIAEYCRQNQIDAVRHVEVLGGRIYLTADFYDERGAWLIRDGIIQPLEPDYIHADTRLDALAAKGDEWAKGEITRRERARIQFAAPETAKAICVQRFRITQTGAIVTGVNWCGVQGGKRDPVGDAEPTKTAQTRARRRAWRQIADVIPQYASAVKPLEAAARTLTPIATVDAPPNETLQPDGRTRDINKTHVAMSIGPGLPKVVVADRTPFAAASYDGKDEPMPVLDQTKPSTTSREPIYEPDDEDEDARQLRLDAERFVD